MVQEKKRAIEIPAVVKSVIQAAAIEIFPHECYGLLLGRQGMVTQTYVHQDVERPDKCTLILKNEPQDRVRDWFGDSIIGDFHSHPNEPARLSRVSDYKTQYDQECSDEWCMLHVMPDGSYAVIVSIWPGKVKDWCFRWGCWYVSGGRISRSTIKWVI